MTIDRLRGILSRTGLDVSARELADVLWLAAHLPPETPGDPGSAGVPASAGPMDAAEPIRSAPVEKTEPALGLELQAEEDGTGGGHRIRVPAAPMLKRTLEIQRALRSLKRSVPSRVRDVMDEAATAAEIARTDRWLPVMTGAPERWLDLALVVDTGATMRSWRPLVRELRAVLSQVGAFRDVHVSYLVGDRLAMGPRATPGNPAALVDPAGRRVVLVLTDCSGRHWWEGRAQPVVAMWARRNATAVLQPLPERLWRRTAAPVIPGLATQRQPCGPNTGLRFLPFEETPPARGIPLPVIELDPVWIGDWARLVAGGEALSTAMTYVSTRPRSLRDRVTEERSLDVEDRLLRFRATASPEAVRLTGYIAVSTPALPVMRRIQRALLPRSGPRHLAEVLLSGLFRHVRGDHYEFVSEHARMAALKLLPRSEAWHAVDVLNRLSADIEASAVTAASTFGAVLGAEPDGAIPRPSGRRPFALLSVEALRTLGDLDIPVRGTVRRPRPAAVRQASPQTPAAAREPAAGVQDWSAKGATSRRPRPPDDRAPYFFLSYAPIPPYDATSKNDPNRWVVKLFGDLCTHIMQMTDAPAGRAGFMDLEPRAGDHWPDRLAEALATCRVFVPLYSPRYFESEQCGREWAAFQRRVDFSEGPDGWMPPAIVPALWVPVRNDDLPGVARSIQFMDDAMGTRYQDQGFYGLSKISSMRRHYQQATYALARRIIEVAMSTHVSVLDRPPRFDELRSAFHDSPSRRPLRVTVVAPDLDHLPHGRAPHTYGRAPEDWAPFPEGGNPRPLASQAEEIAAAQGFRAEIGSLDDHVAALESGDPPDGPVVLVVDPWTELPHRAWDAVTRSARQGTPVILVWNADEQTSAHRFELYDRLRDRLPLRPRSSMIEVISAEEFRRVMPDAMNRAAAAFLKTAVAYPPSREQTSRPRLTGPGEPDE
ncbi:TIR-like protein FxsC [Microbispora rosea]|uniref:TIR-like protein FxsC n=1 Tax=Microbispora rosea TaxID=58117 RepID=UPI00068C2846|nr:TIR-like protein FxsC [Microbispora rosea]